MTAEAMAAQPRAQVNPARLFQAFNAYQLSEALNSAIELDIFSAIGAGQRTAADLAAHCAIAERGARILCDYLTVQGFLTKADGRYGLSEESAVFLDRKSPACLGSIRGFLLSDEIRAHFRNLTEAVRHGGARDTDNIDPDAAVWVKFARSMAPMMMMASQDLARLVVGPTLRPRKVLDIAAGHGMFGIAVGKASPQAQVTAVDWKNVLAVARENAEKAGIAERYTTLPGSIFEVDIGTGYDLILLPNFLHHFGPATIDELLKKLHDALAPGGRVAVLEFVPNEDRVSPPLPAMFSLVMLAGTPEGDAYTQSQLEAMLTKAGLSGHEVHRLPPSPHAVLIARRAGE